MPISVDNLLAYSLQVAALVVTGGLLPMLFRLRVPSFRLAYWQILLAGCLLLPVFQPWQSELAGFLVGAGGGAGAAGRARPSLPAQEVILFALAAGVASRWLWLALGVWRLRRYRRNARRLQQLPASVSSLQLRIGVRPPFYVSSEVDGPLTIGFQSPAVLLPARFPEMDPKIQEAIACHELLHVRRRDWAMTLAEEMIRGLLWFHPAVWWLLAQIRLAREQVVDRQAIELTQAREPYLQALLEITKGRVHAAVSTAPAFLRRRQVVHRIESILKEVSMSRFRLIVSLSAMLIFLVGAGWFAATFFPLQALPPQPQSSAERGKVHRVGDGVSRPELLYRVEPAYTEEARDAGLEGTVVLSVLIEPDGLAHDIEIRRSLGMGLDENAIEAIRQWRFQPGVKDGRPVTVRATVEVNFRLK